MSDQTLSNQSNGVEDELFSLLERRDASDFDRVQILYTESSLKLWDRLLAYTRRITERCGVHGIDCEEVVSDSIEKGFSVIIAQFNSHLNNKVPFQFLRENNLSLEMWLKVIIGKPFDGQRGGVVTNHARKALTRNKVFVEVDDIEVLPVFGESDCQLHDLNFDNVECDLYEYLSHLPAIQQFIIESFYGFHEELSFKGDDLKQRLLRSSFSKTEISKVMNRAKRLKIPKDDAKVTQQELACLLDVSNERQIRRLMKEAENDLKIRLNS